MRESKWYNINVCPECLNRLKDRQVMYRGGTCVYCGHTCNSTVCDYKQVTLKMIKHYRWFEFWKNKVTYIGKNEFSNKYLNKIKK